MFIYITDFVLGLFVGLFAFAAFSPVSLARKLYTLSWGVGGFFVLLAYMGKGSGPAPFIAADQPSTSSLIVAVLLGIAVSIGGGTFLVSSQKTSIGS